MNASDLKDGMVLNLTKPITNPEADRRKRSDWTKAPVFEPGEYIAYDFCGHIGITKSRDAYRIIHRIEKHHPAYNDFLAACVPGTESLSTVLQTAHGGTRSSDILDYYVRTGKLSLDDVKAAIEAIKAEEEAEYEQKTGKKQGEE